MRQRVKRACRQADRQPPTLRRSTCRLLFPDIDAPAGLGGDQAWFGPGRGRGFAKVLAGWLAPLAGAVVVEQLLAQEGFKRSGFLGCSGRPGRDFSLESDVDLDGFVDDDFLGVGPVLDGVNGNTGLLLADRSALQRAGGAPGDGPVRL